MAFTFVGGCYVHLQLSRRYRDKVAVLTWISHHVVVDTDVRLQVIVTGKALLTLVTWISKTVADILVLS